MAGWLPPRGRDVHKYEAGSVLVIGGSPRYAGAGELACRAALRSGAGLVTLAAAGRYPGGWPEVMHWPLDWDDEPLDSIRASPRADARVIGPGLDAVAPGLLAEVIGLAAAPTVLDAGALQDSAELRRAVREHGRCVLTPHEGEAARLLGASVAEVRADRAGAARKIARLTGATVVLKGSETLVLSPDGREALCDRGHPGMATGGSGDALAGCLGALLCTVGDSFNAACLAAFACGAAGEWAALRHGNGLIPSDTIAGLGAVLMRLEDRLPLDGGSGQG